jgi:geranylgeranyl diphosphate synthase, type II
MKGASEPVSKHVLTNAEIPQSAPDRLQPELARAAIVRRLGELLQPSDSSTTPLYAALRHCVLAPGKRLRPLLTLAAASSLGANWMRALDAACAIELVHSASLALDDLPCMDDSTQRRGQPATHTAFGEHVAILAAVSLLNQAYGILARLADVPAADRLAMVQVLSDSIGPGGLVGGQLCDLGRQATCCGVAELHEINRRKTASLFVAALEIGALVARAPEPRLAAVRRFGAALGGMFQIMDDLIDMCASSGDAGKDVGKDLFAPTVASAIGVAAAREEVRRRGDELVGMARTEFGPLSPLERVLTFALRSDLLAKPCGGL